MWKRLIVVLLALTILTAGCSRNQGPAQTLPASKAIAYTPEPTPPSRIVRGSGDGQPAPDFSYRDDQGRVASLSDLRGKPVVLNFWASWCPPCRAEMPLIDAAYRDQSWKEKGVQFLTVNLDENPANARALMSESGYSFPFVLDAKSSIGQAYNVYGIPATFLIDSKGVIVLTKVGAFADGEELAQDLKKLTS